MDAFHRCTARQSCQKQIRGDSRMSRKREKKKARGARAQPEGPVKGRLDTPSHKVHRSDKQYRRRPKHPPADRSVT